MPKRKIHRLDHSKAQECRVSTKSGEICYILLKSSRRRSMEVSINAQEQVRVVVPSFVSKKTIETFLHERSEWILKHLYEKQQANQFTNNRDYDTGHEFLFLGKNYPMYVEEIEGKCVSIDFDEHGWIVKMPVGFSEDIRREKTKAALIKWYRQEAQEVLAARVFHFVREMKLEPMEVAVKTQKRIWGCCYYHQKKIFFNWLLVLAPIHVIDYVIVHELAHLTHPNHSKRFWNKVEKYLPDYKERQDWLKNHMLEMKLP